MEGFPAPLPREDSAAKPERSREQRIDDLVRETATALDAAGCNIPEFEDIESGEAAQQDGEPGFPFIVRMSRTRAKVGAAGTAKLSASHARWAAEALWMDERTTESLIDDLISANGGQTEHFSLGDPLAPNVSTAWRSGDRGRTLIAMHFEGSDKDRWGDLFSSSKAFDSKASKLFYENDGALAIVLGRIGSGVINDWHPKHPGVAYGLINDTHIWSQYDMWIQMRGRKAWSLNLQRINYEKPDWVRSDGVLRDGMGCGACSAASLLNSSYSCVLQPGDFLRFPISFYHSSCHLDEATISLRFRFIEEHASGLTAEAIRTLIDRASSLAVPEED